jgi:hypothetical protein
MPDTVASSHRNPVGPSNHAGADALDRGLGHRCGGPVRSRRAGTGSDCTALVAARRG